MKLKIIILGCLFVSAPPKQPECSYHTVLIYGESFYRSNTTGNHWVDANYIRCNAEVSMTIKQLSLLKEIGRYFFGLEVRGEPPLNPMEVENVALVIDFYSGGSVASVVLIDSGWRVFIYRDYQPYNEVALTESQKCEVFNLISIMPYLVADPC